MSNKIFIVFVLVVSLLSCNLSSGSKNSEVEIIVESTQKTAKINPKGKTLEERILVPPNYERLNVEQSSFANYLRNIKLNPDGSLVKYFDDSEKPNNGIYVAVVDQAIGSKDLHQCADAVMRLRAEYLWHAKKYDEIYFNFTNGHKVEYSEWMKGKRVKVIGNSSKWIQKEHPSNTYQDFWNYMELIFTYAGTASLEKELTSTSIDKMNIGDVFIKGGFPGHAVIVVDMSKHTVTGKTIFLLAQSYMPAQELQILENPSNEKQSPWYQLKKGQKLITPEWTFESGSLKSFDK